MDDLVIIGGGGHGISVFEAVTSLGEFNVMGFIDNHAKAALSRFGVKYLGTDVDLHKIISSRTSAVIGIGQIESPEPRISLGKMLVQRKILLPPIIAASATVSQLSIIGSGSVVLHKALVNANSKIGAFNIVNSSAVIEHGVCTEDYVHVAPGAIILGDVSIGMGSFIGAGAIVREGVKVGNRCLIGAGTFIHRDVADDQVIRL